MTSLSLSLSHKRAPPSFLLKLCRVNHRWCSFVEGSIQWQAFKANQAGYMDYVRMGLIKRAPLIKRLNEEIVNFKIMLDYDRMGFFFL